MADIDAERARDQAKIQTDKEITLKVLELKAQAQTSTIATVDPPTRNRDAKSPKLPAFVDEKGELAVKN